MQPITANSTREEVLAAVAVQDRRRDELTADAYGDWSKDGRVRFHVGPVSVNPAIAAQDDAGEEDQSVRGWDVGA